MLYRVTAENLSSSPGHEGRVRRGYAGTGILLHDTEENTVAGYKVLCELQYILEVHQKGGVILDMSSVVP
jgi:hypothetical protein